LKNLSGCSEFRDNLSLNNTGGQFDMATFPLPTIPPRSYQAGVLAFGDQRQWQVHAACDLVAPAGTEIFAVEKGKVWYGPRNFFLSGPQHKEGKTIVCNTGSTCIMTYEIAIIHPNFIIRYGEVGSRKAKGIEPGAEVSEGQLIGWVGPQSVHTMLHFEMYSNTDDLASLTQETNTEYVNFPKTKKHFKRRNDLMDPTDYLFRCILKSNQGSN
jgi:murein DD-endopeptidase MepM/ murein hydrolase activator NlpD